MRGVKEFFQDESGQNLVEYGLLMGLIAVMIVAALTVLGGRTSLMFESISRDLPS